MVNSNQAGIYLSLYQYLNQDSYLFSNMEDSYDLVIIGAGCMGVAAAYYATKKPISNVCLIEKSKIDNPDRYWSSSFSARQNRVQYNEEYLTQFVVESNKEWVRLEADFGITEQADKFLHTEGALWFGDKNATTNEGNIKSANAVISRINSAAKDKSERIESLYMQKIMEDFPHFMKAFKPVNSQNNGESEWDAWSSLYQPDGGSVNMEKCYNTLFKFIKDETAHPNSNITIKEETSVEGYAYSKNNQYPNKFTIADSQGIKRDIHAKKVLLSLGVETPFFLKQIMGAPYMANHEDQFLLQEYVASYMKIKPEAQEIYNQIPNYYNFLNQNPQELQYSGYGFRYHDWDTLISKTNSKFVKFGTMAANRIYTYEQLKQRTYNPLQTNDHRVKAAISYVNKRMSGLDPQDPENKHYPCPIIFYPGRETILDYFNRKRKSVVIQTGGWIGKYFPLLAKTSLEMLFEEKKIQFERENEDSVIGNFINRTRFPIKGHVEQLLENIKIKEGVTHFDTMVIGAGCSGLYSAYRLNQAKKSDIQANKTTFLDKIGSIGVFDLSDRISGRLFSFKFKDVATPMELGGMRYIPTNHVIVNKIIKTLGIPSIKFPMNGDPIQDHSRKAYLRNDYYNMDEWSVTQNSQENLHTAYRIEGPIIGMDAFQIISFSMYMIMTAPENISLLTEVFLEKTAEEIDEEKKRLALQGSDVHFEDSYYRDWTNYVYADKVNEKNFYVNLNLRQWNQLKPVLLFRFRYSIQNKDLYQQRKLIQNNLYPLYKFGFQNVIEAQFGHEAYQFVSQQNGYFSNTSNASYLDQVMTYLLDFGNVSYRTLAGGFDQLNYAIANILLDEEYGFTDLSRQGIYLHHKLVDVIKSKNQNYKYEVVFHVPSLLGKQSKQMKHKIRHSPLCALLDRFRLREDIKLGKKIPILGNNDFYEIRYTTNRLILGMPRKSVENLYQDIALFKEQKQFAKTYRSNQDQYKDQFYSIFGYPEWNKALHSIPPPLGPQDTEQLTNLLTKQKKSFEDPSFQLTPQQKLKLQELSKQDFYSKIKQIPNQNFEKSKVAKFENDKPIVPKNLMELAASTQIMPAIKVVMNFDRNWWDPNLRINQKYREVYKNINLVNSVENMRGVSVTDLPIRQTLYFSEGTDNLLLGSYNDMITTEFWRTLHTNFHEQWSPNSDLTSRATFSKKIVIPNEQNENDIKKAKTVLVKEILNQLSRIHQIEVKEQWLKECVYQFWGDDIFGGGYHNFYSGYYIPSVMKTIRKPWETQDLHIVGEAYSNETGWVEGAYQTCQKLLEEHLGLPPILPNQYFGY